MLVSEISRRWLARILSQPSPPNHVCVSSCHQLTRLLIDDIDKEAVGFQYSSLIIYYVRSRGLPTVSFYSRKLFLPVFYFYRFTGTFLYRNITVLRTFLVTSKIEALRAKSRPLYLFFGVLIPLHSYSRRFQRLSWPVGLFTNEG